jgi:hypothetical protein
MGGRDAAFCNAINGQASEGSADRKAWLEFAVSTTLDGKCLEWE